MFEEENSPMKEAQVVSHSAEKEEDIVEILIRLSRKVEVLEAKLNTYQVSPSPEAAPIEAIPDSLPGLIEGESAHYVAYNNRHLAAIIIGHDGRTSYNQADLAVFTNMSNVNGVKNFGLQFHQDVEYSEEPRPGTWHWIETPISAKVGSVQKKQLIEKNINFKFPHGTLRNGQLYHQAGVGFYALVNKRAYAIGDLAAMAIRADGKGRPVLQGLPPEEEPENAQTPVSVKLKDIVFQGLGEASMCWSETPKGVFNDTRAVRIGDDIMQAIKGQMDKVYAERNLCVALFASYAQWFGHKIGIKIDPNEEAGWQHILFIDLPTGQVSWHLHDSELENFPDLPSYEGEWDKHTTEEKYKRVQAFIHLGK